MRVADTNVQVLYAVVEGSQNFYHIVATTTPTLYTNQKQRFVDMIGSLKEL